MVYKTCKGTGYDLDHCGEEKMGCARVCLF